MFNKKKTKRVAPKHDAGLWRSAFRDIVASLLVFVLAVVSTDVLLYQLVVVREGWQQTQKLSMLYARHFLTLTNDTIRATQRELDSLDRPEFMTMAIQGNWAALDQISQQILKDNPRLQRFAVLPPGFATLPASANLPFSTQDMVNRTFAGIAAPPEISMVKGQHLLNLVRPLRSDGHVIAVIAASYRMPDFSGEFSSFASDDGYVVLKETVAGAAPVIALSSGSSSWAVANPIRLPTSSANLILEFSPGPSLSPSDVYTHMVLLVLIGQVLVFFMVIAMMLRRFQVHLQADIHLLLAQIDALVHSGTGPAKSTASLQIMQRLMEQVQQMLSYRKIAVRETPAASEAERGTAAQDTLLDHLDVAEADSDLLLGRPAPTNNLQPKEVTMSHAAPESLATSALHTAANHFVLDASMFRAYDIRGTVDQQLTPQAVFQIGQALGSEALDRGQVLIAVGRDGRLSGPELSEALIKGLCASGIDVLDIGRVPTPVLYYATRTMGTESGVMLTGSHNPPNYNGLKMVVAGETLYGDAITALYQRCQDGRLRQGQGQIQRKNIIKSYIDAITADLALARPLKIVLDAGNGITGELAPRLFQELGCEVVPLFCEVDGNFPNHHPDPSKPENLEDLRHAVSEHHADLGLAFDGDGDRVGVITPAGRNVFADRLLMLFAKHVLVSSPGADIIYDVKCTRDLRGLIASHGGRPIMSRTGHSFIKAKLKETNASLAGEMSGHIFFNDRWFGFDDGLYAGARLLEILALETADADQIFAEFPDHFSTPELNITVSDANKFQIVESLKAKAQFSDGQVSTLDGLRVDFSSAWGLIRASNTTPVLVARFEGLTQGDLDQVQARFRDLLMQVDPTLDIPF